MSADHGHAEQHASPGTYWIVAVVLAIITLLEVAIFYIPFLQNITTPILLILSAMKFALVAFFFMHLRYDRPVLTAIFSGGLVVATVIIIILMVLYGALSVSAAP